MCSKEGKNHHVKNFDEEKRIQRLQAIIFKAAITCGTSVVLTILCNIIYTISFYVYPETTDDKGNHIAFLTYVFFLSLEGAFCSILPLANHPRFFKVFGCLHPKNADSPRNPSPRHAASQAQQVDVVPFSQQQTME
jgi:hypothetical protein